MNKKRNGIFDKRAAGLCCLTVFLAAALAGCAQGENSAETETAVPAATEAAPAPETTALAAETAAPAEETSASAAGTAASAEETSASAAGTAALASGTTDSAAGTAASASGTTASAAETAVNAEGTEASAPETGTGTEEAAYPYDFNSEDFLQIEDYWDYAPVSQISGVKEDGSYFELSRWNDYRTPQGAGTDGTYLYMLMNNPRAEYDDKEYRYIALSILYKIDLSTWEIVAQSEPLAVDHGGSVTYNSKTGLLVVANASPNNHLITLIDPETLTIEEVVTCNLKIGAISYNASRDQYVVRAGGRDDFAILDADFVLQTQYNGLDTGLNFQNVESDDDYIYIIDTSANKSPWVELMLVYDWNGNYAGAFRIGSKMENESMFHVGDEYYITFNHAGGRVYKIDIDKSLLNKPQ